MAPSPAPLSRHIARLLKIDPPRAKSLCVTFLGDALAPRGGEVWLSDLIALFTPLGINERLLRTSVFRLVAQGWLTSERHGRRSLYRLSALGERTTQRASTRIYDGPALEWDGNWTLVALPRNGNNGLAERGELRRELEWEGFGMIAPGLFAHPQTEAGAAHRILDELGIPDKALVLSAQDLAGAGGLPIAQIAPQCWNLADVAEQYRQFSRQFAPLVKHLDEEAAAPLDPEQAFILRMLALHHWRRIVLHDPRLPQPMLPADWPGHAARAVCGALYWRLFDASEAHLDALIGAAASDARPAQQSTRFGGRQIAGITEAAGVGA
ncbi:phenylacetic acid degradation operon negative regulatory protein PaaX [Alcaligenaceae bacterium A4P071]|nr:phenylacetic acid degradation operon negative regulatory protein PaaX [Alcaligenaceae bacterium A4P071]